MITMTAPSTSARPDRMELEEAMDQGAISFSRWFCRVMDSNGWSHPTLVGLCKYVTGDKAFLHSSQIAGLRAARLKSPGPRSFVALEYLWSAIDDYQNSRSSGITFGNLAPLVERAEIMRDPEGRPASLGYMVEVFTGLQPVPIDLSAVDFNENQARIISDNAGRIIRRMMVQESWDLVDDIHRVTSKFSRDPAEQEELRLIIKGEGGWDPSVLNDRLNLLSKLLGRVFQWQRTVPELTDELLKKY
jgi:hypothetical protein